MAKLNFQQPDVLFLSYFFFFFYKLNLQKNCIYLNRYFCNIINVFTVTFDQFHVSEITFLNNNNKKILLTLNFWTVVY